MNIVIVIIAIQTILCVRILIKCKDNKHEIEDYKETKNSKEIRGLKEEIFNLKTGLRDVNLRLSKSKELIKILTENSKILDVYDIEIDFHYNQRLTGTSNTKYITNTFVRIDGIVYVITLGKILDDNKYEYELISLHGGYLW